MNLQVTYSDGHVEYFDSNTLTGMPFGRANVLTEFDVFWEGDGGKRDLAVYAHHLEDDGRSTDGESSDADRIRGPRLLLVDSGEADGVETVALDGRLIAWRQGGGMVDAVRFEEACRRWYSGPMGLSSNARAVALFRYLERARPELASDEERICPLFGFSVDAYREAEDEEAGGNDPEDQGGEWE